MAQRTKQNRQAVKLAKGKEVREMRRTKWKANEVLDAIQLYEQYCNAKATIKQLQRWNLNYDGWDAVADKALVGLKELGLPDFVINRIIKQSRA